MVFICYPFNIFYNYKPMLVLKVERAPVYVHSQRIQNRNKLNNNYSLTTINTYIHRYYTLYNIIYHYYNYYFIFTIYEYHIMYLSHYALNASIKKLLELWKKKKKMLTPMLISIHGHPFEIILNHFNTKHVNLFTSESDYVF